MRQHELASKVVPGASSRGGPFAKAKGNGPQHGTARIAVIGTFGNANLGDDALLAAFLRWARANAPRTEVIALTSRPDEVTRSFVVAALDYEGRPAQSPQTAPQLSGSSATAVLTNRLGSGQALSRLKSALKRALPSLWQSLRETRTTLATGWHAVTFLPQRLRVARALDGFVVLGGGQIFDHWGGPTGHPLTVFLWALACRITSVPIVVVSLGGRPLQHRASRWLWRQILETADYVSFRDPDTIALMGSYGYSKSAAQVPDLAFGLSVLEKPLGRVPSVIGVSPMAYRHPGIDPEASDLHYRSYVGSLAAACERLAESGYKLVMFPSQTRSDTIAIDDVLSQLSPATRAGVTVREVTGVHDLLDCIAATDAVIATRFHGVLLSLATARPVVSISYQARKNDRLLELFGLTRFALAAEGLQADALCGAALNLLAQYEAVQEAIVSRLPELRSEIDLQYRRIFSERGWPLA
jgi:polysaccharide pyruvyl transferase WcaK-like protein